MKHITISCLLAALFSASCVLADEVQIPGAAAVAESLPLQTGEPELVNNLELRQAPANPNAPATVGAEQVSPVTTIWVETQIGSSTTWVEVIYTQTFAKVPDQWYTAGTGTIGYGTLTKEKRDLVARETGYAQPVVIALQQEVVTQYIQPVMEVVVFETSTIYGNVTYNGTTNGTALNGTSYGNETEFAPNNGTGSMMAQNLTLMLFSPPARNTTNETAPLLF